MGKVLRLSIGFWKLGMDNKQISSDTFTELAEVVLKNNIFEFDKKTFKQKRGTSIVTKFAPAYAILFMEDFEKNVSF